VGDLEQNSVARTEPSPLRVVRSRQSFNRAGVEHMSEPARFSLPSRPNWKATRWFDRRSAAEGVTMLCISHRQFEARIPDAACAGRLPLDDVDAVHHLEESLAPAAPAENVVGAGDIAVRRSVGGVDAL